MLSQLKNMPKIKPFKAILPSQAKAAEVVVGLENLSISSAKAIGSVNPYSFVHLLVPKIENYYLRGSKQEIAFKNIAENFDDFINDKILVKDKEEAIYIYTKTKNENIKTGIWTVSNIDDYISNHIKKHHLDFKIADENHQIWRIANNEIINKIQRIFTEMPYTYIADGHHRAAAACSYGTKMRLLNLKHNGSEEYNYFSSVYISDDQLEILPFHRFLKLNHLFDHVEVLEFLKNNLKIIEIKPQNLIPNQEHLIGFYYQQKAYQINLNNYLNKDVLHDLDVSLLQKLILKPLFNVNDPREDEKLYFLGGEIDLESHLQMIDNGKYDLAFFLYPTSVKDLMQIADLGETMPPKSTWFEPKFLAGLITHEMD